VDKAWGVSTKGLQTSAGRIASLMADTLRSLRPTTALVA